MPGGGWGLSWGWELFISSVEFSGSRRGSSLVPSQHEPRNFREEHEVLGVSMRKGAVNGQGGGAGGGFFVRPRGTRRGGGRGGGGYDLGAVIKPVLWIASQCGTTLEEK